jgi:hypothetical protein
MKSTTIVAVILGILLIVAGVQAYQLSELKTTLKEDGLKVSSGGGSSGSTSQRADPVPASIKDLPTMVGGC